MRPPCRKSIFGAPFYLCLLRHPGAGHLWKGLSNFSCATREEKKKKKKRRRRGRRRRREKKLASRRCKDPTRCRMHGARWSLEFQWDKAEMKGRKMVERNEVERAGFYLSSVDEGRGGLARRNNAVARLTRMTFH